MKKSPTAKFNDEEEEKSLKNQILKLSKTKKIDEEISTEKRDYSSMKNLKSIESFGNPDANWKDKLRSKMSSPLPKDSKVGNCNN